MKKRAGRVAERPAAWKYVGSSYAGSFACPDCFQCVECAKIVHYDYDHAPRCPKYSSTKTHGGV